MKLKDYMQKEGISIAQAAEQLGLNYEEVRRYYHGITIPRVARLREIILWSKGQVMPNDFFANDNDLPDLTA